MVDPADSSASDSSGSRLPPDLEALLRDVLNAYRVARQRGERPNRREIEGIYPELGDHLPRKLDFIDRVLDAALKENQQPDPIGDASLPGETKVAGNGSPAGETKESAPPADGRTRDVAGRAPGDEGVDQEVVSPTASQRLECPQCGHAIRVVQWVENGVTCVGCGSSFRIGGPLAGDVKYPEIPARIGEFIILGVLGIGSFGIVYKALDPTLNRVVAIKVPHRGYFTEEEQRQQFLVEARSAACLNHPNIVKVLQVGEWKHLPYLVTEFIDGTTLETVVNQRKLGYREVAELIVQVSDAIQYAHLQLVLHRDIKPSNILLDKNHRPYVTDFGLARSDSAEITITMEGQIIGTPAYMSPEQAQGKLSLTCERSDVFSLGVVLYRMLTGEIPFRGSREMTLRQVVEMDPRPPREINDSIPRDLEVITLKAMSKEIHRRYDSAADLASDLRHWLESRPIVARPASPIERLVRWCRRNRTTASLLGVIAALVLLGFLGLTTFSLQANHLRIIAESAVISFRDALERQFLNDATDKFTREPMSAGLPLVKALETNPENRVHRERLAAWRRRMPSLAKMWNYGDALRFASVSSDGRFVAAGGPAGVTVWDLDSLETQGISLGTSRDVWRLAFDGQNSRIAIASRGELITIRNSLTGDLAVPPLAGSESAGEVAWSPDGELLAGAFADGAVRVWNTRTGRRVGADLTHDDEPRMIRFRHDGKRLFVGLGRTVNKVGVGTLYEMDSYAALPVAIKHPTSICEAEFSRDGKQLATCSEDGLIVLSDAETMQKQYEIPPLAGRPFTLRFAAKDATLWVGFADGCIRVWDCAARNWKAEFRLPGDDSLDAVAMDREGRILAASGASGVVCLWNTETLELAADQLEHHAQLVKIDILPDGRRLATITKSGLVRVWDLANEQGALPELPHEALRAAQFIDEGRLLVTASGDKDHAIRAWKITAGPPKVVGEPLPHPNRVRAFDVDARNEQRLISTCADGKVRIWNRRTAECTVIECPEAARSSNVSFLSDGKSYLVWGGGGAVVVGDLDSKDYRVLRGHSGTVEHVYRSPDDRWLAVVSHEGVSRLWSLSDPTAQPLAIPLDRTTSVAFHPTKPTLLLGNTTGKIAAWRYSTNQLEPIGDHQTPIVNVEYDRNGTRFMAATRAGDVFLYGNENQPPRHFTSYEGLLVNCRFDPSGERLLIVGQKETTQPGFSAVQGALQVWDPRTTSAISGACTFPFIPNRVAFSSDQVHMVCSGLDGKAVLMRFEEDQADIEELRSIAELYACRRYDAHGVSTSLSPAELMERFRRVEGKFAPSREAIEAWTRRLEIVSR
jgi:serine/threonine protein kinase/WD40 repeat protein